MNAIQCSVCKKWFEPKDGFVPIHRAWNRLVCKGSNKLGKG